MQFTKFNNFNIFRPLEWIYDTNRYIPMDTWPVFEGNVIALAYFLRHGKPYVTGPGKTVHVGTFSVTKKLI